MIFQYAEKMLFSCDCLVVCRLRRSNVSGDDSYIWLKGLCLGEAEFARTGQISVTA